VKISFRKAANSVSRSPGSWLTLLLLCVVLVPSICLLWFMNQAVQNERLAGRQELVNAYHAHLALAQEGLQDYWHQFADELEAQAAILSAPALFARQVRTDTADAVVCFNASGHVVYPDSVALPTPEEPVAGWQEARSLELHDPSAAASAYAQIARRSTNANVAARALQGEARCLISGGDKNTAISLLTGSLAEDRYRRATDTQGRLILPNAELMALELLKSSAPEQGGPTRERLQALLLDYERVAMPAPQRRFLMRELQELYQDTPAFPTLAAEDLAAQWIATGARDVRDPVLRDSSLAGIWQFSSRGGRIVTLHRTSNLITLLRSIISRTGMPADIRIDFYAPGQEIEGSLLALPVGPTMPGWHVALSPKDRRLLDAIANQRASFYLWIGGLVVGAVAVLALLAWGLVRRQIALTQLRNDLVANVTHELKTPLSSTRLFVETLLNSPSLNEQTAREYLQLIAQENLRLSRLIDNFLMFSRIERNKYVFKIKEASATAIAEDAAAAVRERFQVPHCHFDVSIPKDLPPVMADPDAMTTALVNLLDNAWKFSGEGKRIALAADAQNGSVVFTVRDNGIGLAPRDAKRVFQRFYQVRQHHSPTGGGCGLGLSIVQFIVSAHRGTVRVNSELGRGSTFIVVLPAVTPKSREAAP